VIEGGCLCGKLRYAVDGDIGEVSHCHCSMCHPAFLFVGSKAPWYEITDDLPRHEGWI
jgi:hypothetical protein